jgi:hypothetical protein
VIESHGVNQYQEALKVKGNHYGESRIIKGKLTAWQRVKVKTREFVNFQMLESATKQIIQFSKQAWSGTKKVLKEIGDIFTTKIRFLKKR